ncbi:MAG: metal ABC transporter solute-binding protein [Vulcanimicrobiaceae bacterium]
MIPLAALIVGIVAAENFYGDVARQIGGTHVSVTSILNNPDQDPHLFEASPSVARAVSGAKIVVSNGLDYDPWMDKLIRAGRNPNRTTIVVGELVLKKPGDNPHVWYDPRTMQAYATALTTALAKTDPAHRADYSRNLDAFTRSLAPIEARIAMLRKRYAGLHVTATEPVFGYMLDALGLQVRNTRFQTAVMNNTEPGAREVARFENDLKTRSVRMLVYNSQASDPVAQRMLDLAKTSGVPVVGATETEPPGTTYQAWIARELDAVEKAL